NCRCDAWCSKILTCTCGCHNKPLYNFSDYTEAAFANASLSESLHIVAAKQAAERRQISARLEQLNQELNPFRERQAKAAEHLTDLKRRLLGPWEDNHKYGSCSYIYLLGSDRYGDRHWYSRVWLRLVKRDHRQPDWQWEAKIEPLDRKHSNLDVVL